LPLLRPPTPPPTGASLKLSRKKQSGYAWILASSRCEVCGKYGLYHLPNLTPYSLEPHPPQEHRKAEQTHHTGGRPECSSDSSLKQLRRIPKPTLTPYTPEPHPPQEHRKAEQTHHTGGRPECSSDSSLASLRAPIRAPTTL